MENPHPRDIQAIPTTWRGYRFRSRLEARWAVFFDKIGISFWYEPEAFDLDGVGYLPDFYLPHVNIYAEVKKDFLEPHEMFKAEELALQAKKSTLLLVGPPDFKLYDIIFVNPGDKFPCTTNILLDIGIYKDYYQKERRFFSDPGGCPSDPIHFSDEYQEAVYASRGYRFEEAKN